MTTICRDTIYGVRNHINAVFLDRDGTINHDPDGYITHPTQFQLFPFAAQAIQILNSLQLKTIVVTNQSGVARGLMTTTQVDTLHKHMTDTLASQNAFIDLVLYSPYFTGGNVPPYNIDHITRKPKPGMFFEALKHFPISAKTSYMIGDKIEDVSFGNENGLTTILVQTGNGKVAWLNNRHLFGSLPDFVVENVLSAARLVKWIVAPHG